MSLVVMVNGLSPEAGKMARGVAEKVVISPDMNLVPYSLTGPEIDSQYVRLNGEERPIYLIRPEDADVQVRDMLWRYGDNPPIAVDFTHPDAVNGNANFYCDKGLPFVMGTTGGDREALEQRVRDSGVCAVVAPNMAVQIVALQEVVRDFAEQNLGVLRHYDLEIHESHQKGKADTSGTAKAMMKYFGAMGISAEEQFLTKFRTETDYKELGIPEEHWGGHGWHTYSLYPGENADPRLVSDFGETLFNFLRDSPVFDSYLAHSGNTPRNRTFSRLSLDEAVFFEVVYGFHNGELSLTHNVNGRSVYADGTMDAIRFLHERIQEGRKGEVYSMIDVLNASK